MPTTVSYGPVWKSRAGTVLVPDRFRITIVALQRGERRRQVLRRVGLAQRPADRAPEPHDRVGDDPLGVVQDREVLAGGRGVEQLRVPGHARRSGARRR